MRFLPFLSLAAAAAAQTVVVYDNGPIVTNPTGGAGGAPISELQTTAPYNFFVLGFNVNNAANVRQTEDFTVANAMLVDEIEVFMYNTNATAPSCTGVFVSLFDGDPATGTPNQLIAGAGAAVNLLTAAGFTVTNTMTGIYRVTTTTLTNTQRNVQSVRIALPSQIVLTPGTYHLQWSFTGTSTPFFPPITTLNVFDTGNGQQYTAGAYAPVVMTQPPAPGTPIPGATQGLPFRLWGPSGSALPGSITSLGGGCSAASLVVNGAPTVGGHLRADLSGVNPAAFGLIVVGVTDPGIPAGPCGCVFHASLDAVTIGSSLEVQVPVVASLAGAALNVQGGQLDLAGLGGITNCNLFGLQFDLTDGFRFQLNVN